MVILTQNEIREQRIFHGNFKLVVQPYSPQTACLSQTKQRVLLWLLIELMVLRSANHQHCGLKGCCVRSYLRMMALRWFES